MRNYFDTWKCRCSALSRIAVSLDNLTDIQKADLSALEKREADGKAGLDKPIPPGMAKDLAKLRAKRDDTTLPQGVRSYLREEWIRIIHGRDREIRSKYLEKGTTMEEDALTLVSEVEGKFFVKNREQLEDFYFTGMPDSIGWVLYDRETGMRQADAVDDTKCSWDIHTYYASVDNAENGGNDEYRFQIQGYCALTGASFGRVRRCLLDTPHNLLSQEKKNLYFRLGIIDPDGPDPESAAYRAGCEEIDRAGTYSDIPARARVHTTVIERDDVLISKLYKRVEECRVYLNKLHQDYMLQLNEEELKDLYVRLNS